MAILEAIKSGKNLKATLKYVLNPKKAEKFLVCAGENIFVDTADSVFEQMERTKELFGQTGGRSYHHFVISFPPEEINAKTGKPLTAQDVLEFTLRFVRECEITHKGKRNKKTGEQRIVRIKPFVGYEAVIAVHENTKCLHAHIVDNSVSFENGKKFSYSKGDLAEMKRFKDKLAIEMGWQPEPKKGYNYKGEKRDVDDFTSGNTGLYRVAKKDRKNSYVLACGDAVVEAAEKSKSKREFIELMRQRGFETEWSDRRRHILFTSIEERDKGNKKCGVRLARLKRHIPDLPYSDKNSLLEKFARNKYSEEIQRLASMDKKQFAEWMAKEFPAIRQKNVLSAVANVLMRERNSFPKEIDAAFRKGILSENEKKTVDAFFVLSDKNPNESLEAANRICKLLSQKPPLEHLNRRISTKHSELLSNANSALAINHRSFSLGIYNSAKKVFAKELGTAKTSSSEAEENSSIDIQGALQRLLTAADAFEKNPTMANLAKWWNAFNQLMELKRAKERREKMRQNEREGYSFS